MKLKAHYFHDWLGGWDFDNDMEDWDEVDIPADVFNEYEKSMARYIKACDAVSKAVRENKYGKKASG